jgi:hypothetical protein
VRTTGENRSNEFASLLCMLRFAGTSNSAGLAIVGLLVGFEVSDVTSYLRAISCTSTEGSREFSASQREPNIFAWCSACFTPI